MHAGEEGIRQAFNAIFFITLVLALVPFTYMCAKPFPLMTQHLGSCRRGSASLQDVMTQGWSPSYEAGQLWHVHLYLYQSWLIKG